MAFRKFVIAAAMFVMQKQLADTTITVPVPNHSELRIGTLQSIIRQAGILKTEFES